MTTGMRWRGVKCPSCGCTGTTTSCPKQCTCGFGFAFDDINGPESILVSGIKVPSEYRFWSAVYNGVCGCTNEFDPASPLADAMSIELSRHFKAGSKTFGDFVLSRETSPTAPAACLYSLDTSGVALASTKDDLWGGTGGGETSIANVFDMVVPAVTITTAGKFPLGYDWGETAGAGRYFSGLRRIEFYGEGTTNSNYCARIVLYPQEVWTPYSSRRWETQTGYCSNSFTVPCWATDDAYISSTCTPGGDGSVPTDERYWEIDGFQKDDWDSSNLSLTPSMTIYLPNPTAGLNDIAPNLGQDLSQSHSKSGTVYMNTGTFWEDINCDDFSTETADAVKTSNSSGYYVEADVETKYGAYCDCWSNSDGEGCLPFPQNDTQPDISGYVTNLILTIGATTYTQNGTCTASGLAIVVPTDNGDITLSQDGGNGSGRKVRVQKPDLTPYTFDLSGCSGAITGTSGSDTLSMTWPHGEDCTECPDELVTGCCEYADGTVAKVSGAASCTGTYSGDDTECPPTGCCALVGSDDLSGVTEAHCDSLGGTWTQDATCQAAGWCINDTTGAITADVEENDCTGTWSSTEPVSGCCTISGTQHPDVAQSWCTAQSGTFVAGSCPPVSTDWTTENAKVTINSLDASCDDPGFNCFDAAGLPDYNWTGISSNPCVGSGTRIAALTGDVVDWNGTSLNPTVQQLTVAIGTTAVVITLDLTFDSGKTVRLTANESLPTGNCPSVNFTGSFTSQTGTWTGTCSGTSYDVSDWIGTYNVNLECCTP